jgi:hypothetical protein
VIRRALARLWRLLTEDTGVDRSYPPGGDYVSMP